jgi:hypothetical protein
MGAITFLYYKILALDIMSNAGKRGAGRHLKMGRGLELMLALLILKENKGPKAVKPAAKKSKAPKKEEIEKGIEAKIKGDEPDFEIVVSYGEPLQQMGVLDHASLFSYLGSGAKAEAVEYKEDVYSSQAGQIEARARTFSIEKAYDFIRKKAREDRVSGSASWTFQLDKDYQDFQYWNLFNNAINRALYYFIESVGVSSAVIPLTLQTTGGSH